MKNLLLSTAFVFLYLTANAQSIACTDLSNSVGTWEGKLTYLDYSTGKPYTILANIKIGLTTDEKGYIMGYEYPKEPHANSKDTVFIIDHSFGKDKIVTFNKYPDSGFKMVTEIEGIDGNENKKALIRHTYLCHSKTYSITKEVKFEDSVIWIKRSEYLFERIVK